ncbi:MAG TPA: zinc ribbon domain-containing protein [Vicinamibacterales bacterium]|nr:zinc ribbon domain-containing protein [Vicinamibacterales bacterium]
MPLFDFRCRVCGHEFEALVRPGHPPACPSCRSEDLERQLSTFTTTTRERTQAAADVKRRKEAYQGRRDTAAMDREIARHREEDH